MRHLYCILLLLAGTLWLPVRAQNWRPFRSNGDVHAFRGAAVDSILTLRLDSAGVQGADSVYYFNRIMRRLNSFQWQKARNNQFGQQMRYNPAQRTYVLFWDGGPTPVFTLDLALVLKPFARVGDTWTSINTDVGMPTTLVSRGTALLDGVQDSVATFRVGNAPGTQVVLSKSYGLMSAPKDLRFFVAGAPVLTLARRPAPAGLSYYNPLTLLDLQPGDELGYERSSIVFSGYYCYTGQLLRRVLTRQLTADSIVYTFQNQSRTSYSSAPGCPGLGVVESAVTVLRASASRRTGQWQQPVLLVPYGSDLLAYAYRVRNPGFSTVVLGYPVVQTRPGAACSGPAKLQQEALYQNFSTGPGFSYSPGLDALAWQQRSAESVGVILEYDYALVYTRRTSNGSVQTCGSRANFTTLLPAKSALRAAAFRVFPNPAAESATLLLAAPARPGTTVRLLDALGRTVGHQLVTAGQTTATLLLQGLSPGVYLVEVQAAGEAPTRLRLQH